MSESKKLKTIAFDLDTNALQEHYTKADWHNAYNDIGEFLKDNGFKHTQGSVYDSTNKFSQTELSNFINSISETFDWFAKSVKSIHGYDQPKVIDYTQQVKQTEPNVDKSINLSPSNMHKPSTKTKIPQKSHKR